MTSDNKKISGQDISDKIIETLESGKRKSLKDINQKILFMDPGIMKYADAYKLQLYFFNKVKDLNGIGIILLLEHTPVITTGNNGITENLLVDEAELNNQGIELINSNRGGDITFHGPGQLVGYPILNLAYFKKDITLYVYNLEQVIIELLKKYGIRGKRVQKHRGVFVNNNKIASIGIRVKRWITMHGFSLNVNVEPAYFDNIIPCGLKNYPQISINNLTEEDISIYDVKQSILLNFHQIFKYPVSTINI